MLLDVYPEFTWKIWRFPRVPNAFWNEKHNQRAFLEEIATEMNIKSMEDWYK